MANNREELKKVLADYESRECKQIVLVWKDGASACIENSRAIEMAMETLMCELRRQIEEASINQ